MTEAELQTLFETEIATGNPFTILITTADSPVTMVLKPPYKMPAVLLESTYTGLIDNIHTFTL